MRTLVFSLVLAGVSLGLTLVLSELFVRLVAPQPVSWLAIYRSHPELPFFSMLPSTTLHVDTGETEWTVSTDERGFRVPLGPRPEARCRVLWLGDSFTFGHGVEFEESFVGQIEARTPGVQHLNAAVAGYGPTQYRETLEYLAESGLDFDRIIVVSYVGNDFHDTRWEKNSEVVDGILGNRRDLKSFLKRSSHVYRLLSASYHALAGAGDRSHDAVTDQLATPSAWEQEFLAGASTRYGEAMGGMRAFAAARGLPVSFAVLPSREAAAETFAASQDREASPVGGADRRPMLPVTRALGLIEAGGAEPIDLTPVVGSRSTEEMFFRFDGHLTPEGNRLVAEELLRRVPMRCETDAGSGSARGA